MDWGMCSSPQSLSLLFSGVAIAPLSILSCPCISISSRSSSQPSSSSVSNCFPRVMSTSAPTVRCPAHSAVCSVQTRPGQFRRFYVCSLPPGKQCSFFRWVDEVQHEQFRSSVQNGCDTARSTPGKRPRSSWEGSGGFGNETVNNRLDRASRGSELRSHGFPTMYGGNNVGEDTSPPPLCDCAEPQPCVQRTVRKKGPNTGRLFWACAKPFGGPRCNAFRWADQGPVKRNAVASGSQSSPFQGNGLPRKNTGGVSSQFVKRFRASDPVQLVLNSLTEFSFELPLSVPPTLLKEINEIPGVRTVKSTPAATGTLYGITKAMVPLEEHERTVQILEKHRIRCKDLHKPLLMAISSYSKAMGKRLKTAYALKPDGTVNHEEIVELIGTRLSKKLMAFQRRGVEYALRRGGRCLIGDDMGLGKTVQAIAIAGVYRSEWPLLVVCPSSLRLNWKEELLKWLGQASPSERTELDNLSDQESAIDPLFEDVEFGNSSRHLKEQEINVIMTGKDCTRGISLVNIVSYDLVKKMNDHELQQCGCIIADESHYLKSMQAMRTKVVRSLVLSIPRAILLSGTPALSRPVELFPQVSALEPKLYPSFQEYVARYCNARRTRFGMDYSGASNLDELHTILRASCLVRRKKSDVLTELPSKIRHLVYVETKSKIIKEISGLFTELEKQKEDVAAAQTERQLAVACNAARTTQTKLYQLSADAKIDAILDFIRETSDASEKFVIFGHHQEILNRIEDYLRKKLKIDLIRIDGTTATHKRQELCQRFQTVAKCRAAVLSITAAGVGLNLTATSVVIFAELFWNPGSLLQAEDRAHRIGQKDNVCVKYLMGKNTIDERIWNLIKKKMTIVGKSLTGAAMEMGESDQSLGRPTSFGPINHFLAKAKERALSTAKKRNEKRDVKTETERVNESVSLDKDIIEMADDEWSPQQDAARPAYSLPRKRTSNDIPESARAGSPDKSGTQGEGTGPQTVDLDEMFPSLDQKPCETENGSRGSTLDEDLALARKLQAQFDAEYGQL